MRLLQGDCLEQLKDLPDNSVDSIVTDPPYGLSFMGAKWDYDVPSVDIWKECLRVLKPGGHLLSFGGSRTYHRMVVNAEDAGFEVRDQLLWVYGSGFPKSHNIGKKVEEYKGWGTALKPAHEPILLARKPLSEKTIVDNVLKWGTGGINIDESRILYGENENINFDRPRVRQSVNEDWILKQAHDYTDPQYKEYNQEGRFPANLLLSEEAAENLNEHTGPLKGDSPNRKPRNGGHRKEYVGTEDNDKRQDVISDKTFTDSHLGASKFFYVAKPSKKEKTKGLEKNTHTTIKPIKLMDYLVNLITPKGGVVLDPFMGSGTTGISALTKGFDFIGIERESEYMEIAEQRINAWTKEQQLKLL